MTEREQFGIDTMDFQVDSFLSGKLKADRFIIHESMFGIDNTSFWVVLPYNNKGGVPSWDENKLTFPTIEAAIKFCDVLKVKYG